MTIKTKLILNIVIVLTIVAVVVGTSIFEIGRASCRARV